MSSKDLIERVRASYRFGGKWESDKLADEVEEAFGVLQRRIVLFEEAFEVLRSEEDGIPSYWAEKPDEMGRHFELTLTKDEWKVMKEVFELLGGYRGMD